MDIKIIYRSSIVIGTLAYVIYFFLPYTYGYLDSDMGALLAYSGYGAIMQGGAVFGYAIFTAWIACAIGLFLFYNVARTAYVGLIIFTTALVPLLGTTVETAGGSLLIDISSIMDGAILAMAFFSPIRNEFK